MCSTVFSLEYLDNIKYYMFDLTAVSLNSFTLFFTFYEYMPFILQEGNSLSLLRHHYLSSVVMPRWIKYVPEPVRSCWKWRWCFSLRFWNILLLYSTANQRNPQFEPSSPYEILCLLKMFQQCNRIEYLILLSAISYMNSLTLFYVHKCIPVS